MKQIDVFSDKDFQSLDLTKKQTIATNYFDREMVDEEFSKLDAQKQSQIKENFVNAQLDFDVSDTFDKGVTALKDAFAPAYKEDANVTDPALHDAVAPNRDGSLTIQTKAATTEKPFMIDTLPSDIVQSDDTTATREFKPAMRTAAEIFNDTPAKMISPAEQDAQTIEQNKRTISMGENQDYINPEASEWELGKRVVNRVNELTANAIQGTYNLLGNIKTPMEYLGITTEAMDAQNKKRADWFKDASDKLNDFVYEKNKMELHDGAILQKPTHSWEEVKKGFNTGGVFDADAWQELGNYVGSEGVVSAPDMAEMVAAMPLYYAARQQESAEHRAKNNNRKAPTANDYLMTAPTTMGSIILDRLGLKATTEDVVKNIGKQALDSSLKDAMTVIGTQMKKGFVTEGATESIQNPLEKFGEEIGTTKGLSSGAEYADDALAGFVAGSGAGAGISGATATGTEIFNTLSQAKQEKARDAYVQDAYNKQMMGSGLVATTDDAGYINFSNNLNDKVKTIQDEFQNLTINHPEHSVPVEAVDSVEMQEQIVADAKANGLNVSDNNGLNQIDVGWSELQAELSNTPLSVDEELKPKGFTETPAATQTPAPSTIDTARLQELQQKTDDELTQDEKFELEDLSASGNEAVIATPTPIIEKPVIGEPEPEAKQTTNDIGQKVTYSTNVNGAKIVTTQIYDGLDSVHYYNQTGNGIFQKSKNVENGQLKSQQDYVLNEDGEFVNGGEINLLSGKSDSMPFIGTKEQRENIINLLVEKETASLERALEINNTIQNIVVGGIGSSAGATGNEQAVIDVEMLAAELPAQEVSIETEFAELQSHPRYKSLLDMRKDVYAKDAKSAQNLLQAGHGRELDGYGGTDKMAYDSAQYEKNYRADFLLTKSDIAKLAKGKIDADLLSKLKSDLGMLDNNPDYDVKQYDNYAQDEYARAYDFIPTATKVQQGTQGSLGFEGTQNALFDTTTSTEYVVPEWAKPLTSSVVRYEDIITALTNAKNGKHSELSDRAMEQLHRAGSPHLEADIKRFDELQARWDLNEFEEQEAVALAKLLDKHLEEEENGKYSKTTTATTEANRTLQTETKGDTALQEPTSKGAYAGESERANDRGVSGSSDAKIIFDTTKVYTTKGIMHENPSREVSKKLQKDVARYVQQLQKALNGWEVAVDKKGKPLSYMGVSDNLAPAGGSVSFKLYKPNSDIGVYVSLSYDLVEDGIHDAYTMSDDMRFSSGQLYRTTNRATNKDGSNRWVKNSELTSSRFVRDIMDIVEREENRENENRGNDAGSQTVERTNNTAGIPTSKQNTLDAKANQGSDKPISEGNRRPDGLGTNGSTQDEVSNGYGGVDGYKTDGGNKQPEQQTADANGVLPKSDEPNSTENYSLEGRTPVELTRGQRKKFNDAALEIIKKPIEEITEADREVLRHYTGEGGLGEANENSVNQHYTNYTTVQSIYKALADVKTKQGSIKNYNDAIKGIDENLMPQNFPKYEAIKDAAEKKEKLDKHIQGLVERKAKYENTIRGIEVEIAEIETKASERKEQKASHEAETKFITDEFTNDGKNVSIDKIKAAYTLEQILKSEGKSAAEIESYLADRELETISYSKTPSPKEEQQIEETNFYARANGYDEAGINYVPNYSVSGIPYRPLSDTITLGSREIQLPAADKPINADSLRVYVSDIIGNRLYDGKIKGKSALGIYKRKDSSIRLKNYSDVEIMAHEMAHYLDFFHNNKSKDAKDSFFRGIILKNKDEVKALSYTTDPKKELSEGFAEFVRLWLTNYNTLALVAPNMVKDFEARLTKDKNLQSKMEMLQTGMHQFYYQGAAATLRSKQGGELNSTAKKIQRSQAEISKDIRQSAIDKIHSIKRIEAAIRGDVATDATQSPYKILQLAEHASSLMHTAMHFGVPSVTTNGDITYSGKALNNIFAPATKVSEERVRLLSDYLVAMRASELKGQGRENLITEQEIEAGLLLAQKYPEFETIFNEYQEFNDAMLDFYAGMNLITPEQKENFQEMNKNYVPFHRVTESVQNGAVPAAKIGQRLTGGTHSLGNIMENIVNGLESNIKQALISRGKSVFFKMLDDSNMGGVFATKVSAENKLVKSDIAQQAKKVAQLMAQLGITVAKDGMILSGDINADIIIDVNEIEQNLIDNPSALEFWTYGHKPTSQTGYIETVIINGKKTYFEVHDAALVDSLTSFGNANYNEFVQGLMMAKNVMTWNITNNPLFYLTNFARDTVSASVLSKNKFIPVMTSVSGMYHFVMKTDVYKNFMASGGGYGTRRTTLGGDVDAMGMLEVNRGFEVIDKLLSGLAYGADIFEYGTRVGEFLLATKSGKSNMQSAFEGNEVSTDFTIKGSNRAWTGFLATVPFMKAGINGMDKTARRIFSLNGEMKLSNAVKFRNQLGELQAHKLKLYITGGIISMITLALWSANKDDERYKKLTRDSKLMYWHFFIGDQHIKIPRPYDIGFVFATMPEIVADGIYTKHGKKAADDFAWGVKTMFSIGDVSGLFQPILEHMTNKNWTGGDIIPSYLENIDDKSDQYMNFTPLLYKKAGALTGTSPIMIQHYVDGYLGLTAKMVEETTENLLWNEKEWGERPFERNALEFLTYRFRGKEVDPRTAHSEKYYELMEKAGRVKASFEAKKKKTFIDGGKNITEYMSADEKKAYVQVSRLMARYANTLTDIKNGVEYITYDKKLSKAEKEKRINAAYEKRTEIFKSVSETLEKELKKFEGK